jgi:hypothetical protein
VTVKLDVACVNTTQPVRAVRNVHRVSTVEPPREHPMTARAVRVPIMDLVPNWATAMSSALVVPLDMLVSNSEKKTNFVERYMQKKIPTKLYNNNTSENEIMSFINKFGILWINKLDGILICRF